MVLVDESEVVALALAVDIGGGGLRVDLLADGSQGAAAQDEQPERRHLHQRLHSTEALRGQAEALIPFLLCPPTTAKGCPKAGERGRLWRWLQLGKFLTVDEQ